jgi:LysM repeat protein
MHLRILVLLQLILITFFCSCKASKHLASSSKPPSASSSSFTLTEDSYINTYKDIAVSEMKRTGIPASITLAQGMIESDYGRSTLAREANNHFGIKCHNDWSGQKIYHHDDKRNECFRKYGRAEDSYYDHSEFLKSGSRYAFLFDLASTDYKGWARGLKKAGYATNPDYANMLIRTIEEKNLHYYDNGYKAASPAPVKQPVLNDSSVVKETPRVLAPVNPVNDNVRAAARVQRVMENNKLKYIVVKDGDTREKLEEEFQLLHWELPKYNELSNDFTLSPGQILYLQPKKEKAETGKDFYNTVDGDTMYTISQRYGIRLKSLYKMNRMTEDSEPESGTRLWLRDIKPVN